MEFKWLNHSKIARSISLSKYVTALAPFQAPHHSMRPFIGILGPTLLQARDEAYLLGFFFGFKKKKPV
jgi:hypothetical protein